MHFLLLNGNLVNFSSRKADYKVFFVDTLESPQSLMQSLSCSVRKRFDAQTTIVDFPGNYPASD